MFISIFFEGSEVCQMLNFDILTNLLLEKPLTRSADFSSQILEQFSEDKMI